MNEIYWNNISLRAQSHVTSLSVKHVITLEVKKHYKTIISTEIIMIVTSHWKGLCHSKMELELMFYF